MKKIISLIVVALALGLQGRAQDVPVKASSWQGRTQTGTAWDETLSQANERRLSAGRYSMAAPYTATASESIFMMLIKELRYTDVVGGYAVLSYNGSFKNLERGPFAGVQGALPFEHTFKSGNYVGTCLILGTIVETAVNRSVIGAGVHGELVTIPFVGPAKDSTPVLRLAPGNLSAPLSCTLAFISPVDRFGYGVEASVTARIL